MVERSTCRFCDEVVAPDVTKCPHCGEPLRPRAVLQWGWQEVVLLEPGDMPIGVCFSCARSSPTTPHRRQEPGGLRTVDIPLCASCARRATFLPLVIVGGVSFAGLVFLCLAPALLGGSADLLVYATVAFLVLVIGSVSLIAYSLHSRRVRPRWNGTFITLIVPDLEALRCAVETDAL
jgi:hypothetical protein